MLKKEIEKLEKIRKKEHEELVALMKQLVNKKKKEWLDFNDKWLCMPIKKFELDYFYKFEFEWGLGFFLIGVGVSGLGLGLCWVWGWGRSWGRDLGLGLSKLLKTNLILDSSKNYKICQN